MEEDKTDVFTYSKLVLLFWVGISQICSTEVEDGVGPRLAGRILVS